MASFNRVILAGNLVRDPELRELGDDKVVADVPLAVNEGWGDKQTVSYVDLTLWNQSARFAAQYLSKGSNVLVEGRLKQDRWETEDGKRSKHKVVVDILRSLDKKGDNPQATTEEKPAPVQADSVPF
jgi:single-strand DNA-binding protein|tara:strand:- start:177 stop:557 length:381 start_codon:yes stop_codon:yes gene_type:complete